MALQLVCRFQNVDNIVSTWQLFWLNINEGMAAAKFTDPHLLVILDVIELQSGIFGIFVDSSFFFFFFLVLNGLLLLCMEGELVLILGVELCIVGDRALTLLTKDRITHLEVLFCFFHSFELN